MSSLPPLDELAADGILSADDVATVMRTEQIDAGTLMRRLLPIADRRARTPVSGFPVGAVVQATSANNKPEAMYLGANLEFAGLPLATTVHAEQAAVNLAWLHGATGLTSLAVTAPPCGHCRQFLQELPSAADLKVLIFDNPSQPNDSPTKHSLADLLPTPFGPEQLGIKERLLQAPRRQITVESADPLIQQAAAAAAASHAPYTGNLAGIALTTSAGSIICGRIVESAAFNPMLSPLASALSRLAMQSADSFDLTAAALVEVPSVTSQRDAARSLLKNLAPHLTLRYSIGRTT